MMQRRKLISAAAVMTAFFLAGTQPVWADDVSRFVNGTEINGVSVGGLTQEEARTRMAGELAASYRLTVRERGGVSEEIAGNEIGFQAVIPSNLQALLDEQNASGRKTGPAAANSYEVALTTSWDDGLLKARIQTLNGLSGETVVTSDAHVSAWQEGQPFYIVPEVRGNSLDPVKTEEVIRRAVSSGKTEVDLEAEDCYIPVHVTEADAGLKALCEKMNDSLNSVITYHIGDQTEELPGTVFAGWFMGTENGEITVNREQAAAYIASLAARYDTAGTARTFHTTSGTDVVLSGPYGWKINQALETEHLMLMVQTGQNQEREVQYSSAAASRTAPDWGNTYVEVDLGGQHVYLYQNGTLTWDAPCVTGNVSKNYTTPEGIYGLTYKEADRILRGARKADGSYEYESHVDYWMPFNGGIGLHDASWRDKFGGTIYQYAGSHGCINLPPEKAKILFEQIEKGMPVICHN